ncbi:unnamed protein product [Mytilus coruscus]|uniref:Uncharacterized protein n=1 Tax=Mytilus coruscus TaxID=42192 RepID=A0A6J8C953_MYTCO|nr:unnamed protein product [Mytilus coruscus]
MQWCTIGKRKTPQIDKRMHVELGNLAHHNERDLGDTSLCHACCNGQGLCNIDHLCGAPPCKIKLNASLGIPYVNSNGNVKFNWSIIASTLRTDAVYKVTWTIDGFPLKNKNGISLVNFLSSYERVAILDSIDLQGNLNKMVSPMRISHTVDQIVTIESTLPLISDQLHKLSVGIQIESTGINNND